MTLIQETIYDYAIYGSYILYLFALFGITNYAPAYLDWLKNAIKIYISILLIWRFNPLSQRRENLSQFDRKIVFTSAVFLLLTTSATSFVEHFFNVNSFIDTIK